jgi:hypothetical protein
MDTDSRMHRWSARSGLILGPLAWAINQQFTSALTFAKCAAASPPVVLASGIVCTVVAMAGLFFSWSARRSAPRDSTTSFTATLGSLSAGVFLLVIVAGTVAGFLLPGCYQ